jgi:hypothetical protein
MTSYATLDDLASFLQKTIDNSTGQLALDTASELFAREAATWFAPTSTTFQIPGTGWTELYLPFRPIISVSAVRIAGVTVTDYSRIKFILYRLQGWGIPGRYPPDLVEVDLIHGYAAAPNDVRGAVLETAATAYQAPDNTTASESIDDYTIKFTNIGGMMLSPSAMDLAARYRGTWAV